MSGVRVIGIVGSQDKAAQVREAGIENVVVSAQPGSAARDVSAIVGARSIDVLFDGVGGPGFATLWPLVKPGGTAVLYGHAAGLPPADPSDLAARNVRFVQPSSGQYVNTPDLVAAGSAAIFNALRDGIFGTLAPPSIRSQRHDRPMRTSGHAEPPAAYCSRRESNLAPPPSSAPPQIESRCL